MRFGMSGLLVVVLLLSGCGTSEDKAPPKGDAKAAACPWQLTPLRVIEGFRTPESAAIVPGTGDVIVSNIDTDTEGWWESDGKAFFSRLRSGGEVETLNWKTPSGTQGAPKGVCILGNGVYCADNTVVLRFSLDPRAPINPLLGGMDAKAPRADLPIPGAQKLNDVVTDGKTLFVSDTGAGKVWRVAADGITAIPAPASVNGICLAGDKMFAVSWDLHEVYELDLSGQKAPQAFGLAAHFTNLDGIEALEDGTLLVADFMGKKLCAVAPDRRTVTKLADVECPADLGIDRARGLVYVPQFMIGKVAVYKLERAAAK